MRRSIGRVVLRVLLHVLSLLVAIACFAAWAHFKVAGQHTSALVSLVAAGLFAITPVRDVARIFFAVEGRTLHLVHGLGGLALIALPLTGVVSGGRVLTRAAEAPFAIMGAAQAMMHSTQPRNAAQAAAMQQFASSIPEVAQFAGTDLSKPENAERAMCVLTDLVGKAQVLGQTELDADPNFQSALQQVSTRMGASLGLDAVDVTLNKLAENPATAPAVPKLREQVAKVRAMLAAGSR
jgi:hypothetical protein